jgi:hypothetical protein
VEADEGAAQLRAEGASGHRDARLLPNLSAGERIAHSKGCHDQRLQNDGPNIVRAAHLNRPKDQFCLPGGVELSGNGHTPFVNLSISIPLSWHVLHTVPVSRSRCTCAEHQSGPPARHCPMEKWLDPGLGVVVPVGL